jgi:hypothetical protein
MGGDINRTFTDWNLLQVHMVKDPMQGMEIKDISMQGSKMTQNRPYGVADWKGVVAVYKYDEAMKLLENPYE